MKLINIFYIFVLFNMAVLTACGGGDDGGGGGGAEGGGDELPVSGLPSVLTITGTDAAGLGGSLTLTEYALRPNHGGSDLHLISTSNDVLAFILRDGLGENVKVPDTYPPNQIIINTFTVFSQNLNGISMRIDIGGKTFNYTTEYCGTGTGVACEDITFDEVTKELRFVDVAVEPSGPNNDATAQLILNGTLTWNDEAEVVH